MRYIDCAICNSNQRTELLYQERIAGNKIDERLYSARRIPDRMHFKFVKCLNCGLIFSNPIPDVSKINSLYKKSVFTYSNETKYLGRTYIQLLKKFYVQKKLTKLKLLEIGCGNGFFLKEALRIGFKEVYGVEPGKQAVNLAPAYIKKNIKIDIFRENLFKDNSFDIICSFHTFDHVIDPNKFLYVAKKILKKNGVIFLIVHNTDSLSAKLLGERSPIFDVEHIFLFNPNNLNLLFKKNDLRNIRVFNVKNTYVLNYWFQLFPIPNKIKKILLKVMSITRIGNLPLTISAGNMGIFAKKF